MFFYATTQTSPGNYTLRVKFEPEDRYALRTMVYCRRRDRLDGRSELLDRQDAMFARGLFSWSTINSTDRSIRSETCSKIPRKSSYGTRGTLVTLETFWSSLLRFGRSRFVGRNSMSTLRGNKSGSLASKNIQHLPVFYVFGESSYDTRCIKQGTTFVDDSSMARSKDRGYFASRCNRAGKIAGTVSGRWTITLVRRATFKLPRPF